MRIIAGKFKGKKLANSSYLLDLRPTKDAMRENIFNILQSNNKIINSNFNLLNINVLDICCGTGAFGFEALSRGAKYALLIDNNIKHVNLAQENKKLLNLEANCDIWLMDAYNLAKNNNQFDLIFLDPPYMSDYIAIINQLLIKDWFKKGAIFIVEFGVKENNINKFEHDINIGIFAKKLEILEKRKYGNIIFYFFILN